MRVDERAGTLGWRFRRSSCRNAREAKKLTVIRESGLGATAFVPGKADTWEGSEDSAVPPEKLGQYLRAFRKLLNEYKYDGPFYGHFGQGCVHCSIDFDLFSGEGIAKYRGFVTKAAHLVVKYGGSLSGEHGDGQARGELLPIMYGDELVQAFREFKAIWDPLGKMNPGKIVSPYKLDENLRWAPLTSRGSPTHFAFQDDNASFAYAAHPLRRRGQMPQARRGHDVPELHGYAGGEALDPRPRAPAVRNARGKSAQKMAGRRSREGSARPVPGLQGVQGANARSTSTWRRTRLSSSRTTTRAGCVRARPMRSAGSIGGRGWPSHAGRRERAAAGTTS